MPAIVEFQRVVSDELERFADLFANEPQRGRCGEYLTGLIVARNETVTGINAEFMNATDQSCLNRFVTDAEWNVERFNARRLELLQENPATCYVNHGVIALDDVLVDHDGKLIEDVGWFWDHAEDRAKIAHDYLFANYVCPSGQHYLLEFRRVKKRDQCEATGEQFENHGRLFRQLVDWVCDRQIPGDFAFDSYFSSAENLNHIHGKLDQQGDPRAYVGDLKSNRKLEIRGHSIRADEWAASIPRDQRRELRRGDTSGSGAIPPWSACRKSRIPCGSVLLWHNRHEKAVAKVLVTNRTRWEITRILNTYRQRWTGTETFHRDGKQELGMGDCQLRNARARPGTCTW